MPKAFKQNKQVMYKERETERERTNPDFFKAIIVDCIQAMVFPRRKRVN